MKVLAASDLHLDVNHRQQSTMKNILHQKMTQEEPDVVVIAGDIAANLKIIGEFLQEFSIYDAQKLLVPGNHDVWVSEKQRIDSSDKLDKILPELCTSFGWHFLPNHPIRIGKTAFVGTMGWYDYSLANPKLQGLNYEKKISPRGKMWMDYKHVQFKSNPTDAMLTSRFNTEVQLDLKKIGFDTKINQDKTQLDPVQNIESVVFTSHMVPFAKLLYRTDQVEFDFFHAFLGNKRLGEIINSINVSKIEVLAGHYHRNHQQVLSERITGHITALGYYHEWKRFHSDQKWETLVSNRIHVLNELSV